MRIILTIIFCAFTALISVDAQANLNNINVYPTRQFNNIPSIEESRVPALATQPLVSSLELPALASLKNSPRLASVNFITGNRQLEFGGIEFNDTTIDDCKREGYDKTQCSAGETPRQQCPYNPSYYKSCCDAAFKYDKDACSYPMTISSESCGGKYKCYCDKSLYPVESCTAPQVVSSGDSCTEDGKVSYARCECPSSYSQTCTAQNQQGSGTGCTLNGTTKYTSCECKSGYNLTCSGEGGSPAKPTDYCLLNGIKYYDSCNTCPNRCTVADADKQEGVSYEYEECSKKYCAIGCATNYVNWCTKPETDCAKLGYTKSASQCANGYLQCPYNAAAVFCEDSCPLGTFTACPSGTTATETSTPGCFRCLLASCQATNCKSCEEGSLSRCAECADGYILNVIDGICEPKLVISCAVLNCKTCVSGNINTCSVCNTGYTLQSGKCVSSTGFTCNLPSTIQTCNGMKCCCPQGASCDGVGGGIQCFCSSVD